MFRVLFYYKIALLNELIGLPVSDKRFYDAIKFNYKTITYRYAISAPKDFLISLRIFKQIFSNLFKRFDCKSFNVNSNVAIFDVNSNNVELRTKYIKRISGEEIKLFIGRDELLKSKHLIQSLFTVIILLVTFPFVFFISVFSSNKLKYPLLLINTIEAINILQLLRENKINKLHFFCIYEHDSNLLAYVLMKFGIKVNKIPSEVPMHFLNRTVVADSLSFCFRYQEEEFIKYRDTMHVSEIQHWVPESAFELEKYYLQNNNTQLNTIGFYSSGMWLRNEIDNMDLIDADLYEKELLGYLVEFIQVNPQYKLVVFLHPIEKLNLEKTKTYYNNFLIELTFADTTKPNSSLFGSADVVVSLYSTLAFERIFWGFKTIIMPLGQIDFPLTNTTFNNICAKQQQELSVKLKLALELNAEDYYKKNEIEKYVYTAYNFFK